MKDSLYRLFNRPDLGLLLIRILLGILMVAYGLNKFIGGGPVLEAIGQAMEFLGVTQVPLIWGFLAATGEALGGALFLFGYFFRFASFILSFIMALATCYHYSNGDDFMRVTAYSLCLSFIFLGMIFIGAGKYSLDKR